MGSAAQAAYQWGMTVVLAKFCSPAAVGTYSLALAIVTPILTFTSLQLRAAQATDAKNEYRVADYLGVRLLGTLVGFAVILGVLAIRRADLTALCVVFFVAMAKGCEGVSDIIYGVWQRHNLLNLMGISRVVRAVLTMTLVVALVYVTRSVFMATLGLLAAAALTLGGYDYRTLGRTLPQTLDLGPRPGFNKLLRLAALCLPLGTVTFLNSLLANTPRYFIEHKGGVTLLGFYTALSYVTFAGAIGVSAMAEAAMQHLSNYFVHDLPRYVRLTMKMVGMSALLFAGGVVIAALWGRPLLTLVYGKAYAQHQTAFVWLMAAGGLMYMIQSLGSAITAARQFKVQVVMSTLSLLTSLGGCALLVPRYGLVGAAQASCIANSVMLTVAITIAVCAVRQRKRQITAAE